mmetsp:Transcript_85185/g.237807  ORF Transcript_85185/g.237807 Transcript_85185/m.237807 type:complete len:581 (+) Transcript_85185:34-1776(+)
MHMQATGQPVIVRTAATGPLANRWPPAQAQVGTKVGHRGLVAPAGPMPPMLPGTSGIGAMQGKVALTGAGGSVEASAAAASHGPQQNSTSSLQFPTGSLHNQQMHQEKLAVDFAGILPAGHEGEHRSGKSPGASFVSSVTTLPGMHRQNSVADVMGGCLQGENLRSADALTARVDEALVRLTERLDEAVVKVRTEVPRLQQEDESQRAMLTDMSKEHDALAARVEALERNLIEETESRSELEKALGKDLREYVNYELERMRDTVMREMRERMDGQKVLREEMQLQQGSLMRLASRVDESLVELRTELPRLGVDVATQKAVIDQVAEQFALLAGRVEAVETGLADETAARTLSEQAFGKETREQISREAECLVAQLTDLRDLLEEQRKRMDATQADLKAAHENVDQLAQDAASQRDFVNSMSTQLQETQAATDEKLQRAKEQLTSRLVLAEQKGEHDRSVGEQRLDALDSQLRAWTDAKFRESETGLHSWVESAVICRVNALDKTLRKEMADRATINQQVLDKITHNSERWCQLQSKFDELLVEIHMKAIPSTTAGSHVSVAGSGDHTSLSSSSVYNRQSN